MARKHILHIKRAKPDITVFTLKSELGRGLIYEKFIWATEGPWVDKIDLILEEFCLEVENIERGRVMSNPNQRTQLSTQGT